MYISQREIEEAFLPLERRYKEGLAFSESFRNSLVPSAHVGYDGSWLRVNKALCEYFGYTEREIARLTWPEMTCPEYVKADWQHVTECLSGEIEAYKMYKKYLHKDGHKMPSDLYVSINRENCFFLSQITPAREQDVEPVIEALS